MLFGHLLLSVTTMNLLRGAACQSFVPAPVESPNENRPTYAPFFSAHPTRKPAAYTMHPAPNPSTRVPTARPTPAPTRGTPSCDTIKTEDELEQAILAAANKPRGHEVLLCNADPIKINRKLSLNFGSSVSLICAFETSDCVIEPAAGYTGHFLTMGGGGRLEFKGITFRNFVGTTSAGVLVVERSSLILNDCACYSNAAVGGGCIASYGGILVIQGSRFENNNATYNGGALLATDSGAVVISKTNFTRNNATNGGAAAFINGGTATVADCNFVRNHAWYDAGAIWQNQSSTLTVSNNRFYINYANTAGGAFANEDSKITVKQNLFDSNEAPFGGAGYVFKKFGTASIDMDNTNTFSGNAAASCSKVFIYDTQNCTPSTIVIAED